MSRRTKREFEPLSLGETAKPLGIPRQRRSEFLLGLVPTEHPAHTDFEQQSAGASVTSWLLSPLALAGSARDCGVNMWGEADAFRTHASL